MPCVPGGSVRGPASSVWPLLGLRTLQIQPRSTPTHCDKARQSLRGFRQHSFGTTKPRNVPKRTRVTSM
eukprot:5304760-Amphidinium_carterae.1